MKNLTLTELFAQDPERFTKMHLQCNGLLFDYSKQCLTIDDLAMLCQKAEDAELSPKIKNLFSGAIVNLTEQRAAWHTELRNPQTNNSAITKVLAQMQQMVEIVPRQFTDVVVLGIGGSDLGPRLVCEALAPYR